MEEIKEKHAHGPSCGHQGIIHNGHIDYVHNGQLHAPKDGRVETHVLPVTQQNPALCTPDHHCLSHALDHQHGEDCGHLAIPHGDHVDYLVDGHLHHAHGDHCDDHGKITLA